MRLLGNVVRKLVDIIFIILCACVCIAYTMERFYVDNMRERPGGPLCTYRAIAGLRGNGILLIY